MAKVLLKHIGTKPCKTYQRDIAKIARVTIAARSVNVPKIKIYSSEEITNKKIKKEQKEQKHDVFVYDCF